MINLLDMNKAADKLIPVTSFEYTVGAKSNQFHPEGLFSEIIFGNKETKERTETFSYINLNCKVLHPALVKPIYRLNGKILKALQLQQTYKLVADNSMEEAEDGEINGVTSVIKHFPELISKQENEGIRNDIKNMMLFQFRNNLAFIDKCIVIPAAYRDAQIEDSTGSLRIPVINEYYQKIIKLSLQIKSLGMEEGSPVYEIHAAKMFSLINELYDFIISKLSKKQGMIRQDILGKRVDFSGRAVIVGGAAEIKSDEIGVPYKMLVKIYEPFILHYLYNSGKVDRDKLANLLNQYNNTTLSILSLRQLLTDIQKGHTLTPELDEVIRNSVEEVIKDKALIAKRDPSLHAESVRGYKPVLVDGDSIKICPTSCASHNADFDGDTMALYTPLTQEAIEEVKMRMVDSSSRDGMGKNCDKFDKDFVIGIYTLTKDYKKFESIKPKIIKSESDIDGLHPNYPIIIDGEKTTVGRYIFNKIVPDKKYRINEVVTGKKLNGMKTDIFNEYGNSKIYIDFCHNVLELGSKYFTLMPSTFSLEDLEIPQSILKLKPLLKTATPEQAQKIIDKMKALLKEHLEGNQLNLGIMEAAGGVKGYDQLNQVLVTKGIIQAPDGGAQVVPDSFSDGMKSYDFFASGYASRNGIIARVLNTSDTGYLSRRLVCALQRVEANPKLEDCGTKRFMTLKVTPDIAKRLTGRYIYNDENKLIPFDASRYTNKIVRLRSPIYCQSPKLCKHCYGDLLMRNKTQYVGVLAAQILGEVLSQGTMKQFHLGGTIEMKKVNLAEELVGMMDSGTKLMFSRDFTIDDNKLLLKQGKCRVVIQKQFYKDKNDLIVDDNKIMHLTYGYFSVRTDSYSSEPTIDNKIDIDLNQASDVTENDDEWSIVFDKPNSLIFLCVPTPDVFSNQVKLVDSLFSGHQPYKNADHFCMKVYDIYAKGFKCGADMVHFETLVSNLLRDKGNPSYPARLNTKTYQSVSVPLNSIPKLESWLQAFAFQDPKEAITTGLLYSRPNDETILEKLITNNF